MKSKSQRKVSPRPKAKTPKKPQADHIATKIDAAERDLTHSPSRIYSRSMFQIVLNKEFIKAVCFGSFSTKN